MIFQDPSSALNPVFRVGDQISETLLIHNSGWSRARGRARAIELMELVGMPDPAVQYGRYPHQFSGGMAQRAVIAMAIANRPKVLVADEPTSSLDVTIQAQLLDVLRTVQAGTGAGIVLITHNFGVVAELADSVRVMYAGRLVEVADIFELFRRPSHPYTRALLDCVPNFDVQTATLVPIPGQAPDLRDLPTGCAFHPRCLLRGGRSLCTLTRPSLRSVDGSHLAACHFAEELTPRGD
jgi:oligopeptide/dipeptide ABC transporter ATP-binding protein